MATSPAPLLLLSSISLRSPFLMRARRLEATAAATRSSRLVPPPATASTGDDGRPSRRIHRRGGLGPSDLAASDLHGDGLTATAGCRIWGIVLGDWGIEESMKRIGLNKMAQFEPVKVFSV
uniref:Expressed protein n=2 Tax=Oryza TaxID=4527 RepID=Q10CC8_ORYSJ|nr:expressed protein [Oryza sativa Japonica Group]